MVFAISEFEKVKELLQNFLSGEPYLLTQAESSERSKKYGGLP